jgi:hypothetical protein
MTTMNYTGTLTVVSCTCGIVFAIPDELDRQAHDHGKSITCPLGHSWHYTETTQVKLEREQKRVIATQELLRAEERSHAATRGVVTRKKNEAKKLRERARAGVCPCCHRTFKQLAAHMANKHPDYAEQEPA